MKTYPDIPIRVFHINYKVNPEMRGFSHLSAGLFTRFVTREGPKVEDVWWDINQTVGH